MNICRSLKTANFVLLLFLFTCVFHLTCTCSGMVQEDEWWGLVTFIGDEEHYAVIKHYKKYTTGTSPLEYNGEVLETKSTVFIKNARTGDSKKIFETPGQIANFLPCLPDTAISFVGGGQGHVYKYTGELITNFKGSGVMGGWTEPYVKYITRDGGSILVERDWVTNTSILIDSSNYSSVQPWGIINKWRGAFIVKNETKFEYSDLVPNGRNDQWINEKQIMKHTALNVYDSNYVILFNLETHEIDTLYNLGKGEQSGYASVNSNATLLITSNLELINLSKNEYKR